MPDAAALAAGARTVAHDNGWDALDTAPARQDVAAVPVPVHVGEPSSIKKVVYIIKENRTYDQVLGDDKRGNGDPSLVQFGPKISPNHHAIAKQWVLLDNFYSAGAVSADGHQWVTQADDPDYVERMLSAFPSGRSYPSNGGDALAYLPSGFLWDNAERHHRSVEVFGEYAKEGVTPATSDIPSLDRVLVRDYPPFDLSVPDQHRADVFLRNLASWQRSGTMPDLAIVHLPNDHTTGTTPGLPDPPSPIRRQRPRARPHPRRPHQEPVLERDGRVRRRRRRTVRRRPRRRSPHDRVHRQPLRGTRQGRFHLLQPGQPACARSNRFSVCRR